MTDTSTTTTLYERLGGNDGIAGVVDRLYELIIGDETLKPFFEGTQLDEQKRHMTLFLSVATGGPVQYTGRGLAAAHAGRGIADADFDRVIGHAATALADAGVDAETIGEVAGALLPLRTHVVTAADPEPAA